MPALLTSRSMRPASGQHLIDQFRHRRVIGHVAGQHGNAVGVFRDGTTAGSEHPKARILQGLGRCPSNAGGGPRYEGDTKIWFAHESLSQQF